MKKYETTNHYADIDAYTVDFQKTSNDLGSVKRKHIKYLAYRYRLLIQQIHY